MIEFKNVTFGYQGAESPVISRASFKIEPGEFVLVCGPTGSGKSTLLKLTNGLAPHFTGGILQGEISFDGIDKAFKKPHELAELVGFVNQQPEGSFVADTVGEELAYGLEQLGVTPAEMEARVDEFAKAVGISHLIDEPIASLSGGQQQRVAIAAAMAAGQKLLVLDEPTSALDAVAAAELIALLAKLAKDTGVIILLAEHRLERVLDKIDSVIVVNGDSSVVKSAPFDAFRDYRLLPPVVEFSRRLGFEPIALSVSEAKARLQKTPTFNELPKRSLGQLALRVDSLSVNYGAKAAVKDVSLEVMQGEVVALMGDNGSGKSSLLWAIQGSGQRTEGKVWTHRGDPVSISARERLGIITLVPQRATDLLFLNTLAEELEEADRFNELPQGTTAKWFLQLTNRTDPKQHPRDLSAGQQLALALAVQLAKGASILLLDEPTRGLDYEAKRHLVTALEVVRSKGHSVLLASHDVEFVAQLADRVCLLNDGFVVFSGNTQDVLGAQGELPTQIAQITSQPGLLLAEQVIG